ncbi:hypothetical protein CERSUDRAFT_88853 [Gelatoporia subvermispora B]|uniref:Uncharacterized protein n=1 Tax=Ceriporiopsis subvermispora (strain B) TaxID=914234 RepID=M2Q4F8_CERS8|nr:hypothetical protein CERSUDRAFT_88853 [Gelatoporia subvermispora B]
MTIHRKAQLLDKVVAALPVNGPTLAAREKPRSATFSPSSATSQQRPAATERHLAGSGECQDESSDEAEVHAEMLGGPNTPAPPTAVVAGTGAATTTEKPISTVRHASQKPRKRKAPEGEVTEGGEPPKEKCDRCRTFKRGARCTVPPGEKRCTKCLAERHACYWNGAKYYGDARVKRARTGGPRIHIPAMMSTSSTTPGPSAVSAGPGDPATSADAATEPTALTAPPAIGASGRPARRSAMRIPAPPRAPLSPSAPRRPGRPPKNSASASVSAPPGAAAPARRGPGRPPKNAGSVTVTLPVRAGRPRGRPRRVEVSPSSSSGVSAALPAPRPVVVTPPVASVSAVGAGVAPLVGRGVPATVGVGRGPGGEKLAQIEALRTERAALAARMQLLRDMDEELERKERALVNGK